MENGFVTEKKTKAQKEQENKNLFLNLQESIALQQQSMLQFIQQADKEIKSVQEKTAIAIKQAKIPPVDVDQIVQAVSRKQ